MKFACIINQLLLHAFALQECFHVTNVSQHKNLLYALRHLQQHISRAKHKQCSVWRARVEIVQQRTPKIFHKERRRTPLAEPSGQTLRALFFHCFFDCFFFGLLCLRLAAHRLFSVLFWSSTWAVGKKQAKRVRVCSPAAQSRELIIIFLCEFIIHCVPPQLTSVRVMR